LVLERVWRLEEEESVRTRERGRRRSLSLLSFFFLPFKKRKFDERKEGVREGGFCFLA
jgi:hypothetical protein